MPHSIVLSEDGGFVVTGQTGSSTGKNSEAFLIKYSSTGSILWSKSWGDGANTAGNRLIKTSDEGYLIVGYTGDSADTNGVQVMVAKFDDSGNMSWSRTWGGSKYDEAYAVAQLKDGNFVISGSSCSFGVDEDADMFLFKLNSSGDLLWSKGWVSTNYEAIFDINVTSDGGYVLTGEESASSESEGVAIIKYDSADNLVFAKTLDSLEDYDTGNSVFENSDGNLVIVGVTYSYGSGQSDGLFLMTSGNGSIGNCDSTVCTTIQTSLTDQTIIFSTDPISNNNSLAVSDSEYVPLTMNTGQLNTIICPISY